jgi:16S rRNA (uracil1498-N3)-methyltransferase
MFVIDTERLLAGDLIELDGDEGRHAAVVRRIRPGEHIELTDGAGRVALARVVDTHNSGLTCEVQERRDVDRPAPHLTVVQALPKGDRGELAVEVMTEVGVDRVVPWAASRCITQWRGDRGHKALRKWRSTAREAAKQSGRAWFPDVTELAGTDAVTRRLATAGLALVLHESAHEPLAAVDVPAAGDVVVVVGPEGGIDDGELGAFIDAGARAVRLGPTVLRTSTAGVVAAGVLLSRTARWGSDLTG